MCYSALHFSHADHTESASIRMTSGTSSQENPVTSGVCQDPPGYYYRPGTGAGRLRWHIHLLGGGWCASEGECVNRTLTSVGSSKNWAADPELRKGDQHAPKMRGILSERRRSNPAFHSWNLVVMLYCDGGGYMSIRGPVRVPVGPGKQRMIHMQGWNNVQAVMHDIKVNRGANAATQVLLSGSSAGGQAVIMLCDRMAAAFPAAVTKCLSDSAFITDAKDRWGKRHARQYVKAVATTHNIKIPNCYTGGKVQRSWMCFFPQYALKSVSTPIFLYQSLFDKILIAYAPRDMELRLVNGMVLKVQLAEMAGGVGERVAALEAKLREQGDAMAAMQRDMADMRRAMALLKGMAATGASAEKSEGEGAGKGSASGEAAEGVGTRRINAFAALEVEEVKAQVEATRGEAREMRGEMGTLKAELARMRAAAERQAAEVAYVKATAAHSEARINDAELALAAIKDHVGAESREAKRRKRDEACKQEEMEYTPAGAGIGLVAVGGAPGGSRVEAKRAGKAKDEGSSAAAADNELRGLRARVEALEKTSEGGSKTWEELIGVWTKVFPGRSRMDLSGVSLLTDTALTRLTSMRSLAWLDLSGASGFTAVGLRHVFSLTSLGLLDLTGTKTTDAALEGIDGLKNLHTLDLRSNLVTDVGVQKLLAMTQLTDLNVSECPGVTSASMEHVGELTALTSLRLHDTGVTEDGLQHLSALTALKLFTVPPGVTDSGMKLLRNMKRLERLGLWDANVTVAGLKWLNGLKSLQVIATETEDVECLLRDHFPGMIVTPGPL
ncbi:unnamed protein product [Closterium sp. Yama58-4]|nr:unnamed protein product [Closterium sp. Yama58-4]